MKKYENINEAYLGTLADVYDNPDHICSPRGQQIREKLYYGFQIANPTDESIRTKDDARNVVIESYTKKECDLYNSGTNAAEDFGKASKFWLKLQNPDGTVNSAYGHLIKFKKSHGNPMYELHEQMKGLNDPAAVSAYLGQAAKDAMRTPWEWCVDSLRSDEHTRQAILRFSLPEHFYKGNKDLSNILGNLIERK